VGLAEIETEKLKVGRRKTRDSRKLPHLGPSSSWSVHL